LGKTRKKSHAKTKAIKPKRKNEDRRTQRGKYCAQTRKTNSLSKVQERGMTKVGSGSTAEGKNRPRPKQSAKNRIRFKKSLGGARKNGPRDKGGDGRGKPNSAKPGQPTGSERDESRST